MLVQLEQSEIIILVFQVACSIVNVLFLWSVGGSMRFNFGNLRNDHYLLMIIGVFISLNCLE